MENGDLTIEKILEEKKIFDLSLNFEKFGAGHADREWRLPGKNVQSRFLATEVPIHTYFQYFVFAL